MVVLVMPIQCLRRWFHDDGGAISGFMILVLPVLIMAVIGLNAVWQVANVKQSVHTGVYQAARFLSAQPPPQGNAAAWDRAARAIIERELQANVVVATNPRNRGEANTRGDFDVSNLRIRFSPQVPSIDQCADNSSIQFDIEARIPVAVNLLPGLPFIGGLNANWEMTDTARGEVQCPT